jgi:CobQ-like glutamine amidotransferase family enzyme
MQPARRLRIVHLFPDVLRFYGDGGNIRSLATRAEARGIETSVTRVNVGAGRIPTADLLFIGGGQDREQVTAARELERLGRSVRAQVTDGAALLAICGGYQNLGMTYRTSLGDELACPGLFPVATDASGTGRRLVGHVLAHLDPALANLGEAALTGSADSNPRGTVVGFENHGGRTVLAPGVQPFGRVELGYGNNGRDATEGVLLLPGDDGIGGLRIGTYLHGPLLPRNPHVADALIAAAIARGQPIQALLPLDDHFEWSAHRVAVERMRRIAREDERIPEWAHRMLDPVKALIGY